ncbi:hypothetical protein BJG93_21150 [Paraburkholderia sprentiae WSM5005]|uniref:Cell wall surface anchor family protein n=1 Tax=Paraburkholderia sprentiae WSM5005 TaxID=754502 RepID=A0A1I9YNP3_9BURK|nr:hypothetical protein [Paraburkholderia sprentiae]APA87926.1 hypothetical protein BJG93_21150 [Paraburkholderia sprentiae WSM5005]
MADSVASPQSKPRRVASKKQRQGALSTETENKLARAARSAQHLAQLSGIARDDSTLELFPDDPTRATLEAMNIDVRQGTLHGFELPDVVLQAVGALDEHASVDKAARRAPRVAKLDALVSVNEQLSGFDAEPVMAAAEARANNAANTAPDDGAPNAEANTDDKCTVTSREPSSPLNPAMAAATVARSVTALRQAAEAESAAAAGAGKPQQRFAASFAKAATASRGASAAPATSSAATDGSSASRSSDEPATRTQSASSEAATAQQHDRPSATRPASADNRAGIAASWRDARRTDGAGAALRSEPELDRARATAFADTVDALYGVIADQRRAATDHSRRMKWMLSIVVCALLATVAIGIAQTLLLMRLTRETTAQQYRTEQMMQTQQAAMVSLLDARTAMAATATGNGASAPVATNTTASPQPGVTPTHARHARAAHGHSSNR